MPPKQSSGGGAVASGGGRSDGRFEANRSQGQQAVAESESKSAAENSKSSRGDIEVQDQAKVRRLEAGPSAPKAQAKPAAAQVPSQARLPGARVKPSGGNPRRRVGRIPNVDVRNCNSRGARARSHAIARVRPAGVEVPVLERPRESVIRRLGDDTLAMVLAKKPLGRKAARVCAGVADRAPSTSRAAESAFRRDRRAGLHQFPRGGEHRVRGRLARR